MITGGWASLSVVLRKMRRGFLSLSRVLWNDNKRVLLKVKGCETIGVPLCELEAFVIALRVPVRNRERASAYC